MLKNNQTKENGNEDNRLYLWARSYTQIETHLRLIFQIQVQKGRIVRTRGADPFCQ